MLTGPLLLVIIGCPVWAYFIVRRLTRNQMRGRGLVRFLLWIPLALLPFWQEFYIMGSFAVYAHFYGGIIKLNPIRADVVEIDARDLLSGAYVLEIPGIKYVKITHNGNQEIAPPTYWASKVSGGPCLDPLHQNLIHSYAILPRRVAARGFCYVSKDPSVVPSVRLRATRVYSYMPHSFFMVSDMRQERYQVLDMKTGQVLSEYLVLYAMPGWLRRNIWPYASPYAAPSPWVEGDEYKFPFRQEKYVFFSKALGI